MYQKIKDNKQYTIDEGKKINDQLKQFQDDYLRMLQDMTDLLNLRVKEETDYMEAERVRGHDRMQHLENLVKQEREDRIQSLEDQLNPIRADLRGIEAGIDAERNARVQKEREILDTLHEESAKIEEALEIEKEERLARQAELYKRITTEINRENQWIEDFQARTRAEFHKDRTDIEKEMDNRFEHQDILIKDIKHFISTFQKTLKAVGEKN